MKKTLLIMPLMAVAFSMTGCSLLSNLINGGGKNSSGNQSQQSGSGSGSQSGGGSSSSINLTAQSLLGYSGSSVAYDKEYKNQTVDGVAFRYQQIGAYSDGFAGMQFRNKLTDPSNGTKSNLNNTAAFSSGVQSVAFTWNSSKTMHTNENMLKITFGSSADFGAGSEVKMLNTTEGTMSYTVTPDTKTFNFVKIEIDDSFTYSCYWDSIQINL